VLIGGGLLLATGLIDDLRGISAPMKLLIQLIAAVLAYQFGFRIEVLSLGSAEFALGWLSLPLTLLWVVGVTNAFNLIDGLDGLATGVALVALATITFAAVHLGNYEVAIVCAALVGALLGFLRYNFNPARIFLGDSGSLFVGFLLAVLSVHGSLKTATAVLMVVPLCALAIPLLDTALAIFRRWLRGVPLFGPDTRHIHHRLLASGWSHRRAVATLYLAAGIVATFGLTVAFGPPPVVRGITLAGGVLSLTIVAVGIRRLAYHEFVIAGAVLASGPLRLRRVIQDNIHARDLADAIQQAQSLEDCNDLLRIGAAAFGMMQMEVCLESAAAHRELLRRHTDWVQAWKLDFPILSGGPDEDRWVLRIWCSTEADSFRPYGAERVARILAPHLCTWLSALQAAEQAAAAGSKDLRPRAEAPRPVILEGIAVRGSARQ
jgi:UDP-GlcNAc:undecaprenyl-phosphate GlcNAc-1-phosphate transferase